MSEKLLEEQIREWQKDDDPKWDTPPEHFARQAATELSLLRSQLAAKRLKIRRAIELLSYRSEYWALQVLKVLEGIDDAR